MAKRKQGRSRAARRIATTKRKTARRRPARKAPRAARARQAHRKPAARKRSRTRPAPHARARKTASKAKGAAAARRSGAAAKARTTPKTAAAKVLPKRPAIQHRLQIERTRRTLGEVVPGPPSSLHYDRHASAARSGREELREARTLHTESSPRLTGGDVDANWAAAFSTGDEAPGGDMPTPDQDVVEEIGSSLGVQYADDEELKAADKIAERDRHRWELDPASSEDYRDRTGRKAE